MDVIDEKKLHDQVVEPALDRLDATVGRVPAEIIPALEATMHRLLASAAESIHALLGDAIDRAQRSLFAVEGKATSDLGALITGLDGWTLDIKVRLTRPTL